MAQKELSKALAGHKKLAERRQELAAELERVTAEYAEFEVNMAQAVIHGAGVAEQTGQISALATRKAGLVDILAQIENQEQAAEARVAELQKEVDFSEALGLWKEAKKEIKALAAKADGQLKNAERLKKFQIEIRKRTALYAENGVAPFQVEIGLLGSTAEFLRISNIDMERVMKLIETREKALGR